MSKPNLKQIEAYIRKSAVARGIDPNVAVKVAKSEGLNAYAAQSANMQARGKKNGKREPAYGPFQLLVGGKGTGYPKGLGNNFKAKTGLDPKDPKTINAQIDFALDHAAKTKTWQPWYGAKRVGLKNSAGFSSKTKPIGYNKSAPQYADLMALADAPKPSFRHNLTGSQGNDALEPQKVAYAPLPGMPSPQPVVENKQATSAAQPTLLDDVQNSAVLPDPTSHEHTLTDKQMGGKYRAQVDPKLKGVTAAAFHSVDATPRITSGYRSPSHNKLVKGARNSYHMRNAALDASMAKMDERQRYEFLQDLSQRGINRLGTYSSKYAKDTTHLDTRGKRQPGQVGRISFKSPKNGYVRAKDSKSAPQYMRDLDAGLGMTVPASTYFDGVAPTKPAPRPTEGLLSAQERQEIGLPVADQNGADFDQSRQVAMNDQPTEPAPLPGLLTNQERGENGLEYNPWADLVDNSIVPEEPQKTASKEETGYVDEQGVWQPPACATVQLGLSREEVSKVLQTGASSLDQFDITMPSETIRQNAQLRSADRAEEVQSRPPKAIPESFWRQGEPQADTRLNESFFRQAEQPRRSFAPTMGRRSEGDVYQQGSTPDYSSYSRAPIEYKTVARQVPVAPPKVSPNAGMSKAEQYASYGRGKGMAPTMPVRRPEPKQQFKTVYDRIPIPAQHPKKVGIDGPLGQNKSEKMGLYATPDAPYQRNGLDKLTGIDPNASTGKRMLQGAKRGLAFGPIGIGVGALTGALRGGPLRQVADRLQWGQNPLGNMSLGNILPEYTGMHTGGPNPDFSRGTNVGSAVNVYNDRSGGNVYGRASSGAIIGRDGDTGWTSITNKHGKTTINLGNNEFASPAPSFGGIFGGLFG